MGVEVDSGEVSIEWIPRKFAPDLEFFDSEHWYKWWYGSNKKKTTTIQERLQNLEARQKILYDLIMCESNSRIRTLIVEDECQLFRANAEAAFRIPAKGPADKPLTLIVRPFEDVPVGEATKFVLGETPSPATTATPVSTTVTLIPMTVPPAPEATPAVVTTVSV